MEILELEKFKSLSYPSQNYAEKILFRYDCGCELKVGAGTICRIIKKDKVLCLKCNGKKRGSDSAGSKWTESRRAKQELIIKRGITEKGQVALDKAAEMLVKEGYKVFKSDKLHYLISICPEGHENEQYIYAVIKGCRCKICSSLGIQRNVPLKVEIGKQVGRVIAIEDCGSKTWEMNLKES